MPNDFSGAGQDSLHSIPQLVAGFVQQHIWIGSIYALQLGAQSQLWQFKLQLIAIAFRMPAQGSASRFLSWRKRASRLPDKSEEHFPLGHVCWPAARHTR